MKNVMHYCIVMSVALLCVPMGAVGLQDVNNELMNSKKSFQEMRKTLSALSKDAKQDLATFCGDFCNQIDALDRKHDQLIADVKNHPAAADKITASAETLRVERRALIKSYHNLLAQKIPNLNAR